MALVNLLNVEILDNPAPFANPVQMEITFECIAQLEDGIPHLSCMLNHRLGI
jgi:histone chaperone ASF1